MAMKPRIARICARIQVFIAAGTVPLALLVFLVSIPFGWETAAIAGIASLGCGAGISALGIPIFGLVISWAWPERFGN